MMLRQTDTFKRKRTSLMYFIKSRMYKNALLIKNFPQMFCKVFLSFSSLNNSAKLCDLLSESGDIAAASLLVGSVGTDRRWHFKSAH